MGKRQKSCLPLHIFIWSKKNENWSTAGFPFSLIEHVMFKLSFASTTSKAVIDAGPGGSEKQTNMIHILGKTT